MPNSVALNVPAFTGDDNAYGTIALPEGYRRRHCRYARWDERRRLRPRLAHALNPPDVSFPGVPANAHFPVVSTHSTWK